MASVPGIPLTWQQTSKLTPPWLTHPSTVDRGLLPKAFRQVKMCKKSGRFSSIVCRESQDAAMQTSARHASPQPANQLRRHHAVVGPRFWQHSKTDGQPKIEPSPTGTRPPDWNHRCSLPIRSRARLPMNWRADCKVSNVEKFETAIGGKQNSKFRESRRSTCSQLRYPPRARRRTMNPPYTLIDHPRDGILISQDQPLDAKLPAPGVHAM